MKSLRKVIKVGDSLMISIPIQWAREISVNKGDYVKLSKKDGSIIMIPANIGD